MSTRVIPIGCHMNFNIRMSELRRRLQPPPVPVTQPESTARTHDQSTAAVRQTRSVRRNLFGPIDHEENLKFVQEELNKISDADSRRWNFDFQNDKPMEGRFTWESAKGASVPAAYEMPNLASKMTQASLTPSTSSNVTTKVVTPLKAPPQTTAPSSVVTCVKETEPCGPITRAEYALRSTLNTVTTASTTIISSVAKPPKEEDRLLQHKEPSPACPKKDLSTTECQQQKTAILPKKSLHKISSKQTHITDFLKNRKRAHSPTDTDGKMDDVPSPPLLKRPRTSTT